MKRAFVCLCMVGCLSLLMSATAAAKTPSLKSLAKTVASLQKKVNAQAKTIAALKSDLAAAGPLLAIAPYVSLHTETMNDVKGPNIVFQGANVHIRSASGRTDDNGSLSGLGNLIIGWNEVRPASEGATLARSGSNNLILGGWNGFASYGSLIAGLSNWGYGRFSVAFGYHNQALGDASAVMGRQCTAGGTYSTVTGGFQNGAYGEASSVSGGHGLQANSIYDWNAP